MLRTCSLAAFCALGLFLVTGCTEKGGPAAAKSEAQTTGATAVDESKQDLQNVAPP